jgi:hypothetical protein
MSIQSTSGGAENQRTSGTRAHADARPRGAEAVVEVVEVVEVPLSPRAKGDADDDDDGDDDDDDDDGGCDGVSRGGDAMASWSV